MNHNPSVADQRNLDLFADIPHVKSVIQGKQRTLTQYPDEGIERLSLQSLKAEALANSMIEMLRLDLSRNNIATAAHDLFGQADDYRKLDALIWVFNLNVGGAEISFDWCCENSNIDGESLDPDAVRRIIARSCRAELKRCLQIVCTTFGLPSANQCEADLLDYVNLAGWNTQ